MIIILIRYLWYQPTHRCPNEKKRNIDSFYPDVHLYALVRNSWRWINAEDVVVVVVAAVVVVVVAAVVVAARDALAGCFSVSLCLRHLLVQNLSNLGVGGINIFSAVTDDGNTISSCLVSLQHSVVYIINILLA